MNTFLQKIIDTKLVQTPLKYSKNLVLPGFDGLPFYDVIVFLIEGIQKNSLTTRASSLAFKFFLAIFPTIIFLFSLVPFIPIDDFKMQLLELLQGSLPTDAYEMVNSTIEDLMFNRDGSILSFGFLFAFYLASNGVNSMILAFNETAHAVKKASFIQTRIRSLLILFIIIFLMVIAIGLIVFSTPIIHYLTSHHYINGYTIYILKAVKAVILLIVFFTGISSIYYFGNVKKLNFRFISAGSTLATLLSISLSSGFAFYINNFGVITGAYSCKNLFKI